MNTTRGMAFLTINMPFESWVVATFYFLLLATWVKYHEDKKRNEQKGREWVERMEAFEKRIDAHYADIVAAMKAEKSYIDEGLQGIYATCFQEKLDLGEEMEKRLGALEGLVVRVDGLESKGVGAELEQVMRREEHEKLLGRFDGFIMRFKKWYMYSYGQYADSPNQSPIIKMFKEYLDKEIDGEPHV